MTYCGIEYSLKNRPALDGDFLPFAPWRQAYLAQAAHPIRIAIERQDGGVRYPPAWRPVPASRPAVSGAHRQAAAVERRRLAGLPLRLR